MTTKTVKHFIGNPGFNTVVEKPEVLEKNDHKFIIMVFQGGFDESTNTITEDVRHLAPVPSPEVLKNLKAGVKYTYEPRVQS